MTSSFRMMLKTTLTGLLFTLCNWTALLADVKPASLFGDHMVLQQGMSVPAIHRLREPSPFQDERLVLRTGTAHGSGADVIS
jgi:hypothetical protein